MNPDDGQQSSSQSREKSSPPEATVVVRGGSRGAAPNSPRKGSDDEPNSTRGQDEPTIVLHGELTTHPVPESARGPSASETPAPGPGKAAARKELSDINVKKRSRLPALEDDPDTGIEKEHIVSRDGKADLTFTGKMLASAAPAFAPDGQWQEYRIFETAAGKHVFSKVTRSVAADQTDHCEADVFDPSPSSVSSKLLRGARDLAHSRPLAWTDAATAFFGYDPLAKTLYRKLGSMFEERIG